MQADRIETGILRNRSDGPHQWVTKYADYLYRYAMSRIENEDQARDLVQDTFLAGLEGINKFEGRSSEKTWLTGILKHKIMDMYRQRSSVFLTQKSVLVAEKDQQDFFDPETGHWTADHMPAAFWVEQHDALENKEFNGILLLCIQKLPTLWLSVFTMKYMDDQNSETICTELRVRQSNLWVIIHRAKLNLRACLQKNWS